VNTVEDVPRGHDGQIDEFVVALVLGNYQVLVGAKRLQLAHEASDDSAVGLADPAAHLVDQHVLLLLVIAIFRVINDRAVIDKLFTIAGYTYGPLLGLYAFGLFMPYDVKDRWVPFVVIASPVICYLLSSYSDLLFSGYKFGFELLLVNGIITFAGLLLLKKKRSVAQES